MEKFGTNRLRTFSDSVKQLGGCTIVITKKAYRGINQLLLGWAGYGSPAWASYKQWAEKGMPVRKGEKGSMVVFFSLIEIKELDATGKPKKIPMLKNYIVFNAEQCENYVNLAGFKWLWLKIIIFHQTSAILLKLTEKY